LSHRKQPERPPRAPLSGPGPPGPRPDDDALAIPITDWLDLHTFAPAEIVPLVEDYIDEAAALGLKQVRLIHGKGQGVQRDLVRRTLARHSRVLRFADAPPEAGSWGATIAWLAASRDGVGSADGQ
jgi:dsDNA-specific endonuclease/ATPase MutS2